MKTKIFICLLIFIMCFSACNKSMNNENITDVTTDISDNFIHTVTFEDENGNTIDTQQVSDGDNAISPEIPEKDGYQFIGWDYSYNNVKTDLTVKPVYKQIVNPTFIVEDVNCENGDNISVNVRVEKNTGILGMLLKINYDENVMTLKKVENGPILSEYTFTPPKNMQSGCGVAWNINDIPKGTDSGVIMVLHFTVNDDAEIGEYKISVDCLNNVFDSEYNAVNFDTIDGTCYIK